MIQQGDLNGLELASVQSLIDFRKTVLESICSEPFIASECFLFLTGFPLILSVNN